MPRGKYGGRHPRGTECVLAPCPRGGMGVPRGVSRRYALTWPAHFCDTMQPNQHLFAVVWQVRGGVLQSMREVGRDGDLLGERMLAVLAHATMPYRSLMRTCASMGIPIDLCLAYTGFPATSERKGNSMDLSTI